ncbi:hypothetical protein B843_03325 [Corynebacterium vitaeruminis DSM 20294]|uniref:Uncharacterized protein n=1 Tax=Corynebacterium vitaeruminis DSM 20294 TaxID=1224164 RepID=W5XYH0_9CORY|nr:hypothetical protein B843_03325 [Corynebacterium vitaeruminis DSM 20294]
MQRQLPSPTARLLFEIRRSLVMHLIQRCWVVGVKSSTAIKGDSSLAGQVRHPIAIAPVHRNRDLDAAIAGHSEIMSDLDNDDILVALRYLVIARCWKQSGAILGVVVGWLIQASKFTIFLQGLVG